MTITREPTQSVTAARAPLKIVNNITPNSAKTMKITSTITTTRKKPSVKANLDDVDKTISLDKKLDFSTTQPRVVIPGIPFKIPEPVPQTVTVVHPPPVGLKLPEPAIETVTFAFKKSANNGSVQIVTNNVINHKSTTISTNANGNAVSSTAPISATNFSSAANAQRAMSPITFSTTFQNSTNATTASTTTRSIRNNVTNTSRSTALPANLTSTAAAARIRFSSPKTSNYPDSNVNTSTVSNYPISMRQVSEDLSNFNTEKLMAAKRKLQASQLKNMFSGTNFVANNSNAATSSINQTKEAYTTNAKALAAIKNISASLAAAKQVNRSRSHAAKQVLSSSNSTANRYRGRSPEMPSSMNGNAKNSSNVIVSKANNSSSIANENNNISAQKDKELRIVLPDKKTPSILKDESDGEISVLSSAKKFSSSQNRAKSSSAIHFRTDSETELFIAVASESDNNSPSKSAKVRSASVPAEQTENLLEEDEKLLLSDLPEEMIYVMVGYLSNTDCFNFALAANRQMPHVWGVVVVNFTQQFDVSQVEAMDAGILTQIAASEKEKSGEQWRIVIEQREMMMEDKHMYEHNRARWEAEMDALKTREQQEVYPRFETTVKLLQQTMVMWDEKCAKRAKMAAMCAVFRNSLNMVFGLGRKISVPDRKTIDNGDIIAVGVKKSTSTENMVGGTNTSSANNENNASTSNTSTTFTPPARTEEPATASHTAYIPERSILEDRSTDTPTNNANSSGTNMEQSVNSFNNSSANANSITTAEAVVPVSTEDDNVAVNQDAEEGAASATEMELVIQEGEMAFHTPRAD